MPYVNTTLLKWIPSYLQGVMEYYPDVSLFELNQIQYSSVWRQLRKSKFLYTDGIEIYPVSWFTYGVQTIKGWFGFENYCQRDRVAYVLNKLAYYGYMNQLQQPDFSPMFNKYPINHTICELVLNPYTNANTDSLQYELMVAYYRAKPGVNIPNPFQGMARDHRFGESWLLANIPELIPQLDPQNDSLILHVIQTLDFTNQSYEFIKYSKYAIKAAQYFYEKAKQAPEPWFFERMSGDYAKRRFLKRALAFDPVIATQEAESYAAFYMEEKQYGEAYRLLGLLNDKSLVLKHLSNIPEEIRTKLMVKDSPVAAILATHFLEHKQYTQAQTIYTDIESLNPEAAFVIAVRAGHDMDAYKIFERFKTTINFPPVEIYTLANRIGLSGETEYEQGKNLKLKEELSAAEEKYCQSLTYKKMAYHLNPSTKRLEEVYEHKRVYANLLIDWDVNLHSTDTENSDLVKVQKALNLLHECNSQEKAEIELHQKALAKALMRKVDALKEKISFMRTPEIGEIGPHASAHATEISALTKTLEELIELLKDCKDLPLRIMLGKAHYLYADTMDMFKGENNNLLHHYQKAMEAVPNNPFYILKVSETFDDTRDEYATKGLKCLKAAGFEAIEFYHWSEERWVKRDRMIYDIKDIHNLPSPEISSSWIPSLGLTW